MEEELKLRKIIFEPLSIFRKTKNQFMVAHQSVHLMNKTVAVVAHRQVRLEVVNEPTGRELIESTQLRE